MICQEYTTHRVWTVYPFPLQHPVHHHDYNPESSYVVTYPHFFSFIPITHRPYNYLLLRLFFILYNQKEKNRTSYHTSTFSDSKISATNRS